MAQIANEVSVLIYRISQDVDTLKVTFFMYNDVIEETQYEKLLSHEVLYNLLCEKVQYLHQGGYYR